MYLSKNIPTYLVGLKADLTVSYQVDPSLVQKIVNLFNLQHFTVDAFSDKGVQQMKDIFKSLLLGHYPNLQEGFVYAPTITSEESTDPDTTKLPENKKRETISSINSYSTYSRRESKDSW